MRHLRLLLLPLAFAAGTALAQAGKPADLPIGLKAKSGGVELTFTDTVDSSSAADIRNYEVTVWGLLLGIPIMMAIKAVCDRVDDLKPVGELLGA